MMIQMEMSKTIGTNIVTKWRKVFIFQIDYKLCLVQRLLSSSVSLRIA